MSTVSPSVTLTSVRKQSGILQPILQATASVSSTAASVFRTGDGAGVGAGKQVQDAFVCHLSQSRKVNGNRLWQNPEHIESGESEKNSLLPERAFLQ